MKPAHTLAALALGAAMLAAGGCATHHHGYGAPPANVVYIQRTPPLVRSVIIPPRPSVTAVWISGYWDWNGVDFIWVDGRWDHNPPRPGAVWMPDQWVKSGKGWYRQPGRWR